MTKTKSTNLQNSLIVAALLATATLGGAITTSSTAEAMVLNNCTEQSLYIRLRGQTSKSIMYNNKNLRSKQRVNADISRSQKYQVVIGAGASTKTFSGFGAEQEISFVTSSGGNTEISSGNKCKQAAKIKPAPEEQPGTERNSVKHIAFCLGRYGENYDPQYNEVFLADGTVKECKSPFN
ncbi:MAG: hypothetical protein WBD37_00775 [Anderseniella sp.]